jgi:hypothetical protein
MIFAWFCLSPETHQCPHFFSSFLIGFLIKDKPFAIVEADFLNAVMVLLGGSAGWGVDALRGFISTESD